MDSRDQEDSVSEAFYSDESGDQQRAATPRNVGTSTEEPATTAVLAGQGAPDAMTTNPLRPDLRIPDMTTPEGLAAVRSVLQRVVDSTSRRAELGAGQSWSVTGLGQGDPSVPGHAQGAPSTQTATGAYLAQAPSAAVSSVPIVPGGTHAVTTGPTVPTPMVGGPFWTTTGMAATSTPMSLNSARSAIPSYGGYSLGGVPSTHRYGLVNATPLGMTSTMGLGVGISPSGLPVGTTQASLGSAQPSVSSSGLPNPTPVGFSGGFTLGTAYQPSPGGQVQSSTGATIVTSYGGMPSRIKNAVKMIQPFYSDGSTVEKARAFWNAFERATVGLEEQLRLSAFRECLKGKTAEEWWMYSMIPDFETLRTRFHNQFVCLTPLQMIERLKNAKRTKGMSAEVWGDLISGLCDEAHCYDPQMRYQYFLSGMRNKEWKAALNTMMLNSIEEAVIVLLAKSMHQPVEDDADFVDVVTTKPPTESPAILQMMQIL
ncbi:hypothetical protein PF011_g6296 [Phytophthora fragariae]|uniref:Retrotransposon gag domain-containing protein n=1 Tax=Phytophthora fragariae TaxID=53985 RepID=A0A6A3LG32_9STRA|nr:hypothetical protein PF011_g6296 [Phytophthora fragariae]